LSKTASTIVLDASVILAILYAEPGHDHLTAELLGNAVCSSVNMAEVQTKLVTLGWEPAKAWENTLGLIRELVPFDGEQAELAGNLVAQTKPLGLSLGDRACLALGITLKAPIYTAEQSWKRIKCPAPIQLIR
jgi:PIN domain nuclease of toxin-antitoxin system